MSNMHDILFRLAEVERKVANLISIGVIEEADHSRARVRIRFSQEHLSGWLPWLTRRAKGGEVSWDAPEIGERVMVISPAGVLEAGFVVPALYSQDNPAPINTADIIQRRHSDGAIEAHNRITSERSLVIPDGGLFRVAIGDMEFELGSSTARLSCSDIKLTGNRIELGADSILLKSDNLNLGDEGGESVARKDDPVANGKIVSGSDKVKSA